MTYEIWYIRVRKKDSSSTYAVDVATRIFAPRTAKYLRKLSTRRDYEQEELFSVKNHVMENENHKIHNDQLFIYLSDHLL